jgi:hypothetical protein
MFSQTISGPTQIPLWTLTLQRVVALENISIYNPNALSTGLALIYTYMEKAAMATVGPTESVTSQQQGNAAAAETATDASESGAAVGKKATNIAIESTIPTPPPSKSTERPKANDDIASKVGESAPLSVEEKISLSK